MSLKKKAKTEVFENNLLSPAILAKTGTYRLTTKKMCFFKIIFIAPDCMKPE